MIIFRTVEYTVCMLNSDQRIIKTIHEKPHPSFVHKKFTYQVSRKLLATS
jgi:hypothetical protein